MRAEAVNTVMMMGLMILAFVVAVPAFGLQTTQRTRTRRNHSPTIQSFTSSKGQLDLCPFSPSGTCSSSGPIATLTVKANDPDSDNLTYKYSVSAGTITGSGATVNWDLTESRLGTHTAKVEVMDQRGGQASSVARLNIVVCGACDPPCPFLSVTCPTNVTEGEIAIFEATVSGDDLAQKLTYLWSHSNGKRIAGQEGPKLGIKAIGLPDEVITATVRVLGLHPACNYQASCESTITKRIP